MIKVGKSINESVSINSIKKLFGATKDSEIINLDKSSKFYKSELKKLGCKKVIVTSPGYGFSDEIHAYENNNPRDSSFMVSVIPLKNDGEYNFEVNYLHGLFNESISNDELLTILPKSIRPKKFYAVIKANCDIDKCSNLLIKDGWKLVHTKHVGFQYLTKDNNMIRIWCGSSATSTTISSVDRIDKFDESASIN